MVLATGKDLETETPVVITDAPEGMSFSDDDK